MPRGTPTAPSNKCGLRPSCVCSEMPGHLSHLMKDETANALRAPTLSRDLGDLFYQWFGTHAARHAYQCSALMLPVIFACSRLTSGMAAIACDHRPRMPSPAFGNALVVVAKPVPHIATAAAMREGVERRKSPRAFVHVCVSRAAWLRSCVIADLACQRRRWQRRTRRRFSCSSLHT